MYSHRMFLLLGSPDDANIISLIKGGCELSSCQYSFQQSIDDKGKPQSRVSGGAVHVVMPQVPTDEIIDWGMKSRRYHSGVIVTLNEENMPVRKIIFEKAACVGFFVSYHRTGNNYLSTRFTILAENLNVGDSVKFQNEWIK